MGRAASGSGVAASRCCRVVTPRICRQEAGVVVGNLAEFDAKAGGKWLKSKLGKGDRIRFSAEDTGLGVFNGTSGVVQDIKPGRARGSFVVTVR